MKGHAVTLFDARAKAGGLNEYGIASYKTVDRFAEREVEWLLGIGGITVELGRRLGGDLTLDALVSAHDAVFLGIGLSGVNALGVEEEATENVRDAIDFIAELRQVEELSTLPVGRRVVVIGGGMTAVDAAVQSKLLGAEEVAMVYRRGRERMNASGFELDHAASKGRADRHPRPARAACSVTAPSARWSSPARRMAPTVCEIRARPSACGPTKCSRPSDRSWRGVPAE